MKTRYLIACTLLMLLLGTCTKDESPLQTAADDVSLKAAHGSIIVVTPSPTGDDTQSLIDAFEQAKTEGTGTVVQLVEGEYHIGYILVEDFNGTFKGAGMGKSVIIPLPDLPYLDLYALNLSSELLKFLRGNVTVSNMSFRNLEGEPCVGDDLWTFLSFHDYMITELPDNVPEDHHVTGVVDHVEFTACLGPSGWTQYSVQNAVACGPDFGWAYDLPNSRADITITNCTMKNLGWAFGNLGIDQGRLVFKNNGPVITDGGILLTDNIGGSSLISGNEFFTPAWGGCISVLDAMYNFNTFKYSDGCQYEISGNTFHATDAWSVIVIANDRKGQGIIDPENPVAVLIKSNWFDLQGDVWCAIWNWITDDAIIRNNRFTGTAKSAIYVDERTQNSLMQANNFSNLVCSENDFFGLGPGYNILLLGSNNTVVGGGNNSTTVLNLGLNNKITGAKFDNEAAGPLGQTIADNYRIWRENLFNARKH
jgi:hypothetical protein